MKYLSILLILFVLGCSRQEKCSSFTDLNGNLVLQCCDDGLFRQSVICKCIEDYNTINSTNYECD